MVVVVLSCRYGVMKQCFGGMHWPLFSTVCISPRRAVSYILLVGFHDYVVATLLRGLFWTLRSLHCILRIPQDNTRQLEEESMLLRKLIGTTLHMALRITWHSWLVM